MKLVHAPDLEFHPVGAKHRVGSLEFKYLFLGEQGTLNNFSCVLAKQGKFFSPIHHHNFQQFRYAYKGDVSMGCDNTLQEGEVGFYPEGTWYGPQDDDVGEKQVLVVQFSGPSGQGYMSYDEMKAGQRDLMESGNGSFEDGRWIPNDGGGAVDGYEAVWAQVNGRKLEYPQPKHKAPIYMLPQHFEWVPTKTQRGNAWTKELGRFSGNGTAAGFIRVEEGGSVAIPKLDGIQLVFIARGEGTVEGMACRQESTLKLDPEETAVLSSNSSMEAVHFILPTITKRHDTAMPST